MIFELPAASWTLRKAAAAAFRASDGGGILCLKCSDGASGDISFELPMLLLPPELQKLIPNAFPSEVEQAEHEAYFWRQEPDKLEWATPEIPLSYAAKRYRFEVLICEPLTRPDGTPVKRIIDPFLSRERFLRLRSSGEKWRRNLINFLNDVGIWDRASIRTEGVNGGRSTIVLLDQIWNNQRLIEQGMGRGRVAKDWLKHKPNLPSIKSGTSILVLEERSKHALEALRKSVTIDQLNGVKYGICANPKCKRPFMLSRRDKEYCNRNCTAAMNQRERRERTTTAGKEPAKRGAGLL